VIISGGTLSTGRVERIPFGLAASNVEASNRGSLELLDERLAEQHPAMEKGAVWIMHLFEFNDLAHIPASIRQTLLELMESCNRGFRSFNQRAASEAMDQAKQKSCRTIVELGAGVAPLTKLLAEDARQTGIRLVPCDLFPDVASYRALEQSYPGVVKPLYSQVDYSRQHDFGPDALAALVGTFHHIPPKLRKQTLQAITKSAGRVMVFEPLRNTPISIFLVFFSIVPALLLPLFGMGSRGALRRVLLCWLLPVVPCIFLWDGVVSCLRQWSPARWQRELREIAGPTRPPTVTAGIHSLVVSW